MKVKMKSTAPGQFLGYVIQFPRALLHLLKGGPGDCVSIECLGDVATSYSNGNTLVEEDKSSLTVNPLTDKSENLWKTFSNWVNAVVSGDLKIEKTTFLLCTNKTGNTALVDLFHKAAKETEIKKAIKAAKEKLSDVDEQHVIWPYYDNAINKNSEIFASIIKNFSLEVSEDGPYEEIRKELKKKHVGINQIEFIVQHIGGWLQKEIIEKISKCQIPIVHWEEYDKEFKVFYERSRRRELIDFTLTTPLNEGDIKTQLKLWSTPKMESSF